MCCCHKSRMYNMNDSIYDIAGKYFLGTPLTNEEQQAFGEWLKKSEHQELFADMQAAWDISGKIAQPEDADLDIEWKRFEKLKAESVAVKKLNVNYILSIAASVILVFSVISIVRDNKDRNIEVYTSNAEKELVLPDGSIINLNKNTRLIYHRNFGKKNRHIQLNGEAYFKVTKNQELPFVIETPGKIETRVLGTSFNLRGYEHVLLSELSVITGKVSFGKLHDANPSVFTVNQQVILNKETGELIVHDELNQNALAWRTKKLVFDNTHLKEVAETMEKYFQMKMIIPEHCNDYKFSGKFENPDVIDFATILGSTFNFSYVLSDKAIVFDLVKK